MKITDHYEINVSCNGQHYFATNPRSLTSNSKAFNLFHQLTAAFPLDKGYAVKIKAVAPVTSWDITNEA
tara:strand:- start:34 stop:240 length:207 start_codon:yes stop_codon:yes gene_type:complete